MASSGTKVDAPPVGRMFRQKWNPPKDIQHSFANRTIIVTGSNTGIGFHAALKFVKSGASKVILGVRTLDKGEEAKSRIEQETGSRGVVEVWKLDMLNYDSIKDFATRAQKDLDKLDIVVLNAGVMAGVYEQSRYGWEMMLQVNVLSTVLLSLLLLPKLRENQSKDFTPVLELVSSSGHQSVRSLATSADQDLLQIYNEPSTWDAVNSYSISKLFLEVARDRLAHLGDSQDGTGPNVVVVSVCPGATQSGIFRNMTGPLRAASWVMYHLLQRTTEEGARAYISAVAIGPEAHGRFWYDGALQDPIPLLVGEDNQAWQVALWEEIVSALKKDVPTLKV